MPNLTLSFANLLAATTLLLAACGGPQELPDQPNTPGGPQSNVSSPCAPGYAGADSDGDKMSDDCEVLLGLNPNDSDSNDNGIGDGFDEPPNANDPANQDHTSAWKQAMAQALTNPLMLGSSSWTGSAPAGYGVSITKQQMAFGNLSKQPSKNLDSKMKSDDRCKNANNIWWMAEGTVNLQPVRVEFCGVLKASKDLNSPTANPDTSLTGSSVGDWTFAFAEGDGNLLPKGGTYFFPGLLKTSSAYATVTEVFEAFTLHDLNPVTVNGKTYQFYNKLDVTLKTNYQQQLVGPTQPDQPPLQFESEQSVQKKWKRTSNPQEQIVEDMFAGALGLWTNAN